MSTGTISYFTALHNRYEKKIKDYNFGSLIRTDARGEYGEKNTIFGSSVYICRAFLPTDAHCDP